MRFTVVVCVLVLVGLTSVMVCSQPYTSVKDSLLHVIKTAEKLSIKGEAHNKVARQYITTDMKTARAHLDTAFQLFEQLDDSTQYAKVRYTSGILYRFSSEYQKADEEFEKFLMHAIHAEDTFGQANAYFQRGVVDHLRGNYNHSITNFQQSFSRYEQINDSLGMAYVYNSVGIVYNDLNMDSLAIVNYEKAANIWKLMADSLNLANTYNNLGISYFEKGNFTKAMEFYELGLAMNLAMDSHWGISITKMNIGDVLTQKKLYREAITILQEAIDIQEREHYNQKLAEAYARLAVCYFQLGQLAESEAALQQGLAVAGEAKAVLSKIHIGFASLYEKQGKYKLAYLHFQKYSLLNDSIFEESKQRSLNQLLVQFETAQKDKAIAENELRIKQQQVALLAKQQQYTFALLGIGVLLLVVAGLWLFYRQKQRFKSQEIDTLKKQKEIEILSALISGEERERKRLAQDLHDGINGDLSVIKHLVSTLDDEALSGSAKKNQQEALTLLDVSCEQVRLISHNLAPMALRDFNLKEAIHQYCFRMSKSHGVKISFQQVGDQLTPDANMETTIFRMIQELVNNVIKHANATETLVQLNHYDGSLHITVEDNGKGFDLKYVEDGLGIKSVKSRVSTLNGTFHLNSSNLGTTIEIEIATNKTHVS